MRKALLHCGDVFAALTLVALVHRLRLTGRAIEGSPLFEPAALQGAPLHLMTHLLVDLLVAAVLAAALLPGFVVVQRISPQAGRWSRAARLAMHCLALGLVAAVSLITLTHYSLLVVMHTGLSADLVLEAVQAGAAGAPGYLSAVELFDAAALVLAPALYVAMACSPDRLARYGRVGAAAVVAAAVVLTLKFLPPVEPLAPAVSGNPLVLLARDLLDELHPPELQQAPLVEEAPPRMYAQLRRPAAKRKGRPPGSRPRRGAPPGTW